jgi:hypothetical protein
MTVESYPLHWPAGWPRSTWPQRGKSRFSGQTVSQIKELQRELRLLGARNVVISSNVPVRQDGLPYADAAKRRYDDPGVAIYFTLKQKPLAMARDRYWTPWENMRSLVLAIESIRSIERHGGQTMMERAFSGFTALPAPNRAGKFLALSLGPVCKQSNRSSALRPRSHTRTLEFLTLQWPSLSSHTTKLSRRPSYEHR